MAGFLLQRNRVEEDFRADRRALQAKRPGRGRMQCAIGSENLLRSQPQRAGLAGVIGITRFPEIHQLVDRCASGLENRQHFRLGVIGVELARRAALPAARRLLAGQYQTDRRMLAAFQIAAPHFKQPDRRGTARAVALGRGDQAGQHRRPHDLEVLADRIGQRPAAAAKGRGFLLGDKAPVDHFVQPARCRRAAGLAFGQLLRRSGRLGHARLTRQRRRWNIVQPLDADDFLDDILPAGDIAAPGRHGDGPCSPAKAGVHLPLVGRGTIGRWVPAFAGTRDFKTQRFQYRLLPFCCDINPAQRQTFCRIIGHSALLRRRRAGPGNLARLPAAQFQHQRRGQCQPVIQKRRVNPAFEPLARIAGQHQLLTGPGDIFRGEIGAFDQDLGRRFV